MGACCSRTSDEMTENGDLSSDGGCCFWLRIGLCLNSILRKKGEILDVQKSINAKNVQTLSNDTKSHILIQKITFNKPIKVRKLRILLMYYNRGRPELETEFVSCG